MRQTRLVILLLTVCWHDLCCCAPVTLFMSRSYTSCTKYEWPKEVLSLMFKAYKPFPETYTEEQANNFVVNGLVHLERNMKADEVFDILGSDGNHISRSFVYGTDEALGPRYKTRWRWLPLIDGFDQEGKPLYHTSMWSDGTIIKSMDLLRLDYFYSHDLRFFLPTAIVRPIHNGIGFGHGLQFTQVYEYSASFAKFLRMQTSATASQLYDAVRRDSSRWLSLVSNRNRASMERSYQTISAEWIQQYLPTTFRRVPVTARPPKPRSNSLRISNRAPDSPSSAHRTEVTVRRHRNIQHDQPSGPVVSQPHGQWSGPAFDYPHSDLELHETESSRDWAFTLPIYDYRYLQRGTSSREPQQAFAHQDDSTSMQLPSTELQLGQSELHSRVSAPAASRLTREQINDGRHWLQISSAHAAGIQTTGGGSIAASIGSHRSGFAPWRKPPQAFSNQPGLS